MKVLIVSSHADDLELGMGGFIKQHYNINALILSKGITSRNLNVKNSEILLENMNKYIKRSSKILGYNVLNMIENPYIPVNLCQYGYPDNCFDSMSLLDIVKAIEYYIEEYKPDTVFTHHFGDLNIDHQITHKAVMTACRPVGIGKCVKKILTFEVLSSTEWNSPEPHLAFVPNYYVELTALQVEKKIKAMECYKSELQKYPAPRSKEGIMNLAKRRGNEIGVNYAEAFRLVRWIE